MLSVKHKSRRANLAAQGQPSPRIPGRIGNSELSAHDVFELGLTYRAMDQLDACIQAFRQSVALDPKNSAVWLKLGDALADVHDAEGAEMAYARALEPGGNNIKRVAERRSSARLTIDTQAWAEQIGQNPGAAGPMLREHLRRHPTDAAAMGVLAEIGILQGFVEQAQKLLQRAIGLAPHHAPLRLAYVDVLLTQGRNALALPVIEALVSEQPRNAQNRIILAICLAKLGEVDRSLALFKGLLSEAEKDPFLLFTYAELLRAAGRHDDSMRLCRSRIKRSPSDGRAWWSLARLPGAALSASDLSTMRSQVSNDRLAPADRMHLHYALGAALEQLSEYGESFEHYARGAALKRASLIYNADDWTREAARQTAFFTQERLETFSRHGHADPAPIFIIGLPRVGSTLIEQILGSHSLVEATHELMDISDIAASIGKDSGLGDKSSYPERLLALKPQAFAALGARYIAQTRRFRKSGKPYFIDKMPSNWIHLGLVHAILPGAKIIDARRHPMASGFAAFKYLFADGVHYSYDLAELGRCYNDYAKTMTHFDAAMPGRVFQVEYENLVTDTEAEVRRLLAYCGLPFEPACLRFWEVQRTVATPSAQQVRQPIFSTSKDQWRNYEEWLAPLHAALDPLHRRA